MGLLFEHIDDAEIVAQVFPYNYTIAYSDAFLENDKAPIASIIIDNRFELIPKVSEEIVEDFFEGERKKKTVTFSVIHYMDNAKEQKIICDASFENAIIEIHKRIATELLADALETAKFENSTVLA
jgi:hypothetical protein